MNKERIDRLFEIFNLGNVDEEKAYQEMQAFFSMEDIDGEELEEKVDNFMQDIEKSGLIDYFLSKAKENKENECVRGILCEYFYDSISDDTILDKLIENPEEYGLNVRGAGYMLERIGDARIYKKMDRKLERRQKNSEIENPWNMLDLLKIVAMKDPEYVKEFIEYNEEILKECDIYGDSAVELIKTVGDPEYIKELLENPEKRKALSIYGNGVEDLIKTVEEKEPGYIKECLENVEKMQALGINEYGAVELIKTVEEKEPGYIKECLENPEKMQALGINNDSVIDLIKTVEEKEPGYIKECLENVNKMLAFGICYDRAIDLIKTVEEKEPGYIKECLQNVEKMKALGIKDDRVADLIKTVEEKEPGFIIECIKNKEKWKFDYSIINPLKRTLETEYIKENSEVFLKAYGLEEKDISSKAEILEQMYEINDEVYQKLDFRLLDNKYLKLLGEDKINQISCYPEVQELVLKLNEKNLKAWAKCIDTYIHNNDSEEWTVIAKEILDNISNGQYNDLIENIDNLDNADINKLIKVLQAKNVFGIKCEKDLENFELIKLQKCDKLIQSSKIGDKKLAVLEKLFGTDDGYAKSLLRRYGQGIDSLPESEAKNFIKSIQMLVNCQSGEILEQIYNECEETVFIDKVGIEKALKKEYAKLYNAGLFKIENAVPIGENMYSAGTDFKMIITSLGAYSGEKRQSNYKNDWNRPKINTQHLCASYIRQDMMGTAIIKDICYGFDCMREDSLVLSGPVDIFSSRDSMISTSLTGEEYFVPDEQINHTCQYNEMDFKRIQGGEKKQPSYIVVFLQNGIIDNLKNAEKASKDWGGLPIVVIDKDECLESERNKVKQMEAEYIGNPSPELARAIYYKIRNNRVTDSCFCTETDISRYKFNEQAVSKRELAENSNEVSGEDRRDCMAKIRTAIEKVKGDGEVER